MKFKLNIVMLSSDYSFQQLDPSNYKEVNEIGYSFWKENGVYSKQALIPIISQNLSYCIKKGQNIISFCIIEQINNTSAYVFLLATRKEYQKQGLAKYILEQSLLNSLAKGIVSFSLHTETTNTAAINLYTKMGFDVLTIEIGYYKNVNKGEYSNYQIRNVIDPMENSENALVMVLNYD